MKNIVMGAIASLFLAGAASAAELAGSVGVEVTENTAGSYVAETTLSLGVSAETGVGMAFGGFTFESVDGADVNIDEWQIGLDMGQVVASVGRQDDVFVEGRMEIVGEGTLGLPEDSTVESVIVQWGSVSAFVGFDDLHTDVSDVRNLQLAYHNEVGAFSYAGAVDYNTDTTETMLGFSGNYGLTADLGVGGVATYGVDSQVFGYEAYADYKIVTVFVNGTDDDLVQNLGGGVNYDFDNVNVYAEAEYNFDSNDTAMGFGVAFNF